ncbi:MAG: hypothetical protein WC484_07970 [Candidatus Omnitrophota bacterium]
MEDAIMSRLEGLEKSLYSEVLQKETKAERAWQPKEALQASERRK